MWFKNKRTGRTWEVTDEDLQERLKSDPDYEEVRKPATGSKKKTKK